MAKRITNRLRQESEADESDLDTEAENESTEAEDEDEATEAEGRAEDDDEDEDMESDDGEDGASASASLIAKGRRMERRRIGKILDSKAAQGGRQKQARFLAFKTDMAADDAVAVLQEAPKGGGGSFSERADRAGSPRLSPGSDVKADGPSEEAATSRITASARRLSGDGRYRRAAT